jgi:hypothetical protein
MRGKFFAASFFPFVGLLIVGATDGFSIIHGYLLLLEEAESIARANSWNSI